MTKPAEGGRTADMPPVLKTIPAGWRPNVAAIILDAQGNLLLGKEKANSRYWHCPQGGVEAGESMEEAVCREVWEETRLPASAYKIVTHHGGFRYTYPARNRKSAQWLGQEQTYYLLVCHKTKPKTDLSKSREFSVVSWFPLGKVRSEMFVPFKRGVITQALETFFSTHPQPPTAESRQPRPSLAGTPGNKNLLTHIEQTLTMNRYLVPPGKKLKLKDYSPDDKSLFAGTKEESTLAFDTFKAELQELQKRLFAQNKHRILVILQGMDASGKDGCIRNVFSGLDPQGVRVVSFKRPTPEELAHDFLWRVHREVPGNGQLTIFNRSQYEDIIAVRVKKLFGDDVWKRRYKHIRDFEDMLVEEGTTIIKIFLNISKAEQRRRLESRIIDPQKLWKLEPSDFADRLLWDDFMSAYQDMIEKTSTPEAPWYLIPADRKWYRNLVVARLLVEKLRALDLQYPQPKINPAEIVLED